MAAAPAPIAFTHGDCLTILPTIADASVDAIYLDPPFDSNREYHLSADDATGFSDKWTGDDYEQFIRAVVQRCVPKLKPAGSLFFHISADRMFIPEKVVRESFKYVQPIFWKRCRSKNNVKNKLGATIDIIFKCSNARVPKFNLVSQEKDAYYLEHSFKNADERGQYSLGHLVTEPSKKGHMYAYTFQQREYNPPTGWRIPREELETLDRENRLHIPKTANSKLYKKVYLAENPGKPCTDLWDDVHSIAQGGEQRMYPTAKPVALLERIIRISTDEGDLVLDPMCGSGTTGVACRNLGRRCMLIDRNPDVEAIVQARLQPRVIIE